MLLLTVLVLPVLSLAISLPAMLTAKALISCPDRVRIGVPARTALKVKAALCVPPVRCKIRLHNRLSGQRFVGKPGELVPTEHCGAIDITYKWLWVYDYLGLFRIRRSQKENYRVLVEPVSIPGEEPRPQDQLVTAWKPKPGGGYAENHDLRLYRPGDDLRQIHWKMSQKTKKLIYREPMEPANKSIILVLTLSGTPQEKDTKMGRLQWLCSSLLQQDMQFEIRCMSGEGELHLYVHNRQDMEKAMDCLLKATPTQGEWNPPNTGCLWQYRIGGEPDA